jgi:hypothetical protein
VLATAAEKNVRTWQFAIHEPTAFTVTYGYKLVSEWKGDPDNPSVVLRFPTAVEISTSRWPGSVDMPMSDDARHTEGSAPKQQR